MANIVVSKSGGGLARVFGYWFRFKIMFIFVLFILLNSIIIGVQAKDFTPVVQDLGNRLLTPTLQIQEFSQEVIENEGLYERTPHYWGGMGNFLFDIWGIFTQFYLIMIWLGVLALVSRKIILWDDSKGASSYLIAIGLFFLLQMLYIASMDKGTILSPIIAFKDLVIALPYLVEPLAELGDVIINDNISNITA
ncbi:hypothetical protein CL617_00590 [archaeon]|nr:hypothetical protein [archaeon]|tara:strand:- start:587 stop:1168 length:582 start_codon:yes stop_codon:yes gene_type:complete